MGLADKALNKVISKKLLVWVIATVMFFMDMITSDQWFSITQIWMAGVAIIDTVKTAKKDNGDN
jgi:hypothetical protein